MLDNLERKICSAEHAHTTNRVLANYRKILQFVQDDRISRSPLTEADALLSWACERWMHEVHNRPLRNIHRRTLDNTCRQVIRRL